MKHNQNAIENTSKIVWYGIFVISIGDNSP